MAKNNKPILSVLIDEDKRTKFADLARRHSLAMGWLVNQAIDKMIEADSIDIYRDSTHSLSTHISSVESIDIENIVKTSIDNLDIENLIKTSIANLNTPSVGINEVENLVNISIDNRITPLTESVTELETYTQNQFKAVREELKKALTDRTVTNTETIALPTTTSTTASRNITDKDPSVKTWTEFFKMVGVEALPATEAQKKENMNIRAKQIELGLQAAREQGLGEWTAKRAGRDFMKVD